MEHSSHSELNGVKRQKKKERITTNSVLCQIPFRLYTLPFIIKITLWDFWNNFFKIKKVKTLNTRAYSCNHI